MCTVCLKMCVEESVFNSFWELPVSVTVVQYMYLHVIVYVCVLCVFTPFVFHLGKTSNHLH